MYKVHVCRLNKALCSNPSAAELEFSADTRPAYNRIPDCRTRSVVEFNFNGAPLHSRPTVIYVMVENSSTVDIGWCVVHRSGCTSDQ